MNRKFVSGEVRKLLFQESIQQLSLQYSALFAFRQSCVVLMTFPTIDLNM